MANQKRYVDEIHQTDPNQQVVLTITIGNDQSGGSRVWFDPNQILAKGPIIGLNLGMGSTLIGKTLYITTNIYDSNTYTNNVVVTYNFNNGSVPCHVYFDTVANAEDTFTFICTFQFQ